MKKPMIVAIDDEAEFIAMLEEYFKPRGYDIEVAVRGAGIEPERENRMWY
jgi:CheY-like chemotaxis protein